MTLPDVLARLSVWLIPDDTCIPVQARVLGELPGPDRRLVLLSVGDDKRAEDPAHCYPSEWYAKKVAHDFAADRLRDAESDVRKYRQALVLMGEVTESVAVGTHDFGGEG